MVVRVIWVAGVRGQGLGASSIRRFQEPVSPELQNPELQPLNRKYETRTRASASASMYVTREYGSKLFRGLKWLQPHALNAEAHGRP